MKNTNRKVGFFFLVRYDERTMLGVIVLGAGRGKRMVSGETPKVLILFRGKPMIGWVLDAVRDAALPARVVVVVGHGAASVQAMLGPSYTTVMQHAQRGTGDAVRAAQDVLKGQCDDVLVLYGDHPMLQPSTIRALVAHHQKSGATLTMATTIVPDFEGWRRPFAHFGRIVRHRSGDIMRIVEAAMATPEELAITEVNPAYMCFRAAWLWDALSTLTDDNPKHEYLLTDLVARAITDPHGVETILLHDSREALGVNTRDELTSTEQVV